MLREDGRLLPTTRFELTQRTVHPREEEAAETAREFMRRHWTFREPVAAGCDCGTSGSCQLGSPADFYERAQSHFLCISGMAFQDVWNIDLGRLRRCCIHVVTPQRSLVPFCAYYVTSTTGQRLYSGFMNDRARRAAGSSEGFRPL